VGEFLKGFGLVVHGSLVDWWCWVFKFP